MLGVTWGLLCLLLIDTSGSFKVMKIALLHDSVLPPSTYGGIERIVMALAREYTRLGHEVVILARKGSQIRDYAFQALPQDATEFDHWQWLPHGIDFLHSHQPLKTKPPLPFLVTIHGNGHAEEKYWANTNFLSRSHTRNHGAKYFVFNGVDPDRYPFRAEKQDYFVFLAKTTWRVKNVKTAIAWANDLGVRLKIMGGSGISRGNIEYCGLVSEEEKVEILAHAKALIYPTNWDEPCAAAPLEALACGTPVITSNNGCMPELIRPGTGVVCHNYDELLRAAAEVSKINPRECRKAVEEFFSLKRMAQDYLVLIEKIRAHGDLDQNPQYSFKKESVQFLFKPTLLNKLRFALTGKI